MANDILPNWDPKKLDQTAIVPFLGVLAKIKYKLNLYKKNTIHIFIYSIIQVNLYQSNK